jgi:hypothetical protein
MAGAVQRHLQVPGLSAMHRCYHLLGVMRGTNGVSDPALRPTPPRLTANAPVPAPPAITPARPPAGPPPPAAKAFVETNPPNKTAVATTPSLRFM